MSVSPTHAHLSKASDRYQDWLTVFGTDRVELEAPGAILATVPDRGTCEVYKLKLSALTEDQRERLVAYISHRFNLPFAQAREELARQGCPILASDVHVSFDRRLVV